MKKTLTLLVLAALLLSSFPSCGNSTDNETTAKETTNTTEITPDNTEITVDLPEGLSFSGATYTILSREDLEWENEMCTPELTGDTVNDAVYNREITVEERLNVAIDAYKTPGIWGNEWAFFDKIRAAVQAGDASYQLVAGYAYYIPALAAEGLFTNLLDVNYINFDKPWWNSDLRDELTLYGQLYFGGGDLSWTMIAQMYSVFFNKDMAEEYAVEDLYTVVEEGRWTYDYMSTLVNSISRDVNGDGKMDENDEYGLVLANGNQCDTFFASYNQSATSKDSSGNIVLRLGDAKAIDCAEKMMTFYNNKTNVYSIEEDNEYKCYIPFKEGRALLNVATLAYAANQLREVDFEYGILPMAKYDEDQEEYHTMSQDAYSLFCVPLNAGDTDMIGAVTELMAYESWENVTPAYFEVALKSKYSRDEASSQMLDLIRDGALFNFGFVNSYSCENMMHILRNVAAGNQGYATVLAANEQKYQTALDTLVQAYKDMEE